MSMKCASQPDPPSATSPRSSMELPYGRKNLGSGGVERKTSSCLTFSRGWLRHVAQETSDIAEQGFYMNSKGERVEIQEQLQKALDGTTHYHSSHVFELPPQAGKYKTQFIVAYGSSLQVATQLQDENSHVGILNSASAKTPNKFLRGTISQEECICRASLLHACLRKYEGIPHHFYYINNKPKYQNNASACAIFAPHVPIIRQDSARCALLDQAESACFVSIPAPNAFVVGREQDVLNIPKAQSPGASAAGEEHELITLHQALQDRIHRALCMFLLHGCKQLVLCAYGCGVHGNDPKMVAGIFRNMLLETNLRGQFETVVFAIQPSRTGNYKAFVQTFSEATAL